MALTAIFTTIKLAPHLLGPIAIAAYSYMALVPVIIPMVVKLLCTKTSFKINMKEQEKLYPSDTEFKNMQVLKIVFHRCNHSCCPHFAVGCSFGWYAGCSVIW